MSPLLTSLNPLNHLDEPIIMIGIIAIEMNPNIAREKSNL